MIPVAPAPEPANFNARVREPGQKFLQDKDLTRPIRFRGREYWRRTLGEMHDLYSGICAYTCHYIPLDTGSDTVEHFLARRSHPGLAYEWGNFRFVCNRMNGRKSDYCDVVDPFQVTLGMFELDFPSLQISAGNGTAGAIKTLANSTIARLKLNEERTVKARLKWVIDLRDNKINGAYMEEHAPFIHSEMARLGITQADLPIFFKEPA
jgi:hypothetical protein